MHHSFLSLVWSILSELNSNYILEYVGSGVGIVHVYLIGICEPCFYQLRAAFSLSIMLTPQCV